MSKHHPLYLEWSKCSPLPQTHTCNQRHTISRDCSRFLKPIPINLSVIFFSRNVFYLYLVSLFFLVLSSCPSALYFSKKTGYYKNFFTTKVSGEKTPLKNFIIFPLRSNQQFSGKIKTIPPSYECVYKDCEEKQNFP